MIATESVIRSIGNSKGIIIDKNMCDDLGLYCGSRVFVQCDGDMLTITPVETMKKPRIGIAKGEKLVDEAWFSEEFDEEIAKLFGAVCS